MPVRAPVTPPATWRSLSLLPVDLAQFINVVRQIDEFFIQVVRLPGV